MHCEQGGLEQWAISAAITKSRGSSAISYTRVSTRARDTASKRETAVQDADGPVLLRFGGAITYGCSEAPRVLAVASMPSAEPETSRARNRCDRGHPVSRSDGGLELSQALAVERVPHPLAPPVAVDEPGVAQDLQVVRDGGLALAEGLDEVAHADLALGRGGQQAQDPQPDRVGEGGEPAGQRGGLGGVERGGQHRWAALAVGDGGAMAGASPWRSPY